MTDLDVRSDRALAAFLGLAVGDALGAAVEFMTPREIVHAHGTLRDLVGGGWLHLSPGETTDDTAMSLILARSLVARGGLDLVDLCDGFVAWLRSGPPDVGATCARGIRRYMATSATQGPAAESDAGNGAAMRALPVALATLDSPDDARAWTLAQAHVTHVHPLSDAACLALVDMVRAAIAGADRPALRERADALVAEMPTFAFEPLRGASSAFVVETMRTVFDAFFGTESFEDCLVTAVNRGGDADTTAAIVGTIAGAFYGTAAIPERWRATLDPKVDAEIRTLVPALLALSDRSARTGR